jgi:hypothetical protein
MIDGTKRYLLIPLYKLKVKIFVLYEEKKLNASQGQELPFS